MLHMTYYMEKRNVDILLNISLVSHKKKSLMEQHEDE